MAAGIAMGATLLLMRVAREKDFVPGWFEAVEVILPGRSRREES